ncbi:MAG TPA: chemotaxis protein CheW [Polyangiaceae bacterium]|jgi:purine-binding chemotaxis protein CheW
MGPSSSDPAATPALIFRARGRLCALPLEHVVATMRPLPVEAVPGSPACVIGLAIVRGVAVPVVDLARLLDASPAAPVAEASASSPRFLALRVGDRAVALAVDSVLGVQPLTSGTLRELPPLLRDANSDAVTAVGTLDGELLLVLRAARLVPDGALEGSSAGAPA